SRPDRGDFQGNPELLARMQSAVISAPAHTVTAHDWPQWRGPRRDGIAGAFNLLAPWPAGGPRVLWRAKTGAGYSSPVVAGNRVFLLVQDGEHEAVVCWDAASGSELWRHRYAARFTNPESGT